jgi:hypothetical protein
MDDAVILEGRWTGYTLREAMSLDQPEDVPGKAKGPEVIIPQPFQVLASQSPALRLLP